MDRINHLFNDHLKGDRTIWMVALLLGVMSLLAVYSASSWMGWRHDGGTHVMNTSEVGRVKVVDYKSKGAINKRIYIEIE